jgi:uncharacterized protein (DUF433 family)
VKAAKMQMRSGTSLEEQRMNETIEIVDRGRGPQLSTTRITVLDLVPYFQVGSSYDEILRWIPTLVPEELAAAERYYLEHKIELDDKDRRVREYREEQIRLQRLRFPEIEETREELLTRLRQFKMGWANSSQETQTPQQSKPMGR